MSRLTYLAVGGLFLSPALATSGLRPRGPLKWGKVNFISTSDTHGWLLGHKPYAEPAWTGTLGDVANFVIHMKEKAKRDGVDLFFVDSGDMTHGSGLSDGGPEGSVEGARMIEAFTNMPYDVLTIGNHELYNYTIAENIYKNFAPKFNRPGPNSPTRIDKRYLTSNVHIIPSGSNHPVPIGGQYTTFQSDQGLSVTAFGVTFNFDTKNSSMIVTPPEKMVTESWFQDTLKQKTDMFLLVGHMSLDLTDKWPVVQRAIREKHPKVPIFVFGGHTHYRNCRLLDDRTIAVESGRYLETIGWVSANFTGDDRRLELQNRFLDVNRETFMYHSRKNQSNFDTKEGEKIDQYLRDLSKEYNLHKLLGVVPEDYYFDRIKYPSPNHIWTFFSEKVMPEMIINKSTRAKNPHMVLLNNGFFRGPIFRGNFTRNDLLVSFPYPNEFVYLSVPWGLAKDLTGHLKSKKGASSLLPGSFDAYFDDDLTEGRIDPMHLRQMVHPPDARTPIGRHSQSVLSLDTNHQEKAPHANMVPGYNTVDSCNLPDSGDDTLHYPNIEVFRTPSYNFTTSFDTQTLTDTTNIDLITLRFLGKRVIESLNDLIVLKRLNMANYTEVMLESYSSITTVQALEDYAQIYWKA